MKKNYSNKNKTDDKIRIDLLHLWHSRFLLQNNNQISLFQSKGPKLTIQGIKPIEEPIAMVIDYDTFNINESNSKYDESKKITKKDTILDNDMKKECIKDLEVMPLNEVAEKYSITQSCLQKWKSRASQRKRIISLDNEIQLLLWYFETKASKGYVTIESFRNKAISYSTKEKFYYSIGWIDDLRKRYPTVNISFSK